MGFSLVIPTLNGGTLFRQCLDAIKAQTSQPVKRIVIDSSSSDGTADLARSHGFEVVQIPKKEFDHGGTRNLALSLINTEVVIFMTQDAVLNTPESFAELLDAFMNEDVAGAYGRQLPHFDASPVAKHARLRNYGEDGYVTGANDLHPPGIKKCFLSNSFSAFRVAALTEIGGFPLKLIMGEDMYAAGRLLERGKRVAYVPSAAVRHSHNYSIAEEFHRYFDIGVFHAEHDWLQRQFGQVSGEGIRFARDQIAFLVAGGHYLRVPESVFASAAKFAGYQLGRRHQRFGARISARMAMHKGYFRRQFS